jgi:hypothetical protein
MWYSSFEGADDDDTTGDKHEATNTAEENDDNSIDEENEVDDPSDDNNYDTNNDDNYASSDNDNNTTTIKNQERRVQNQEHPMEQRSNRHRFKENIYQPADTGIENYVEDLKQVNNVKNNIKVKIEPQSEEQVVDCHRCPEYD